MRRKLQTLVLAALTIGLLGSCSKIDERISNLEKRVDGIEATSIASVQQQIDGIKTSINDLKAADAAINGKIDELKKTAETQQTLIDALKEADIALGQKDAELEARIATLEGQVTTIGGQIETLVNADKAINTRIDELKSYVDTQIGNTKDWAEETFATLDQYQQTADDLAALSVTVTGISTTLSGVQTSISGLGTKIDGINTDLQGKITAAKTELEGKITSLKTELEGKITTAITASETSIKSWINGLLEGYYTIAEVEEKIGALNTAIDAAKGTAKYRIDSLATELTKLKTAVDTEKEKVRSEYKTAIATAITKLDGEIRGALKDSILAVNGRIAALDTRVTTLEGKVQNLEGNVNKLLAMIQSVSITPAYSDGSVEAEDGILTLKCIVRPAEALTGMQSLKDSLLIYADLVKVKTKTSSAYTEIKVKEASVLDAAQGAITLKADISEYLPEDDAKALTVALKIKNGISDFTTEFVPVYVAPGPVLPDGALKGEFTINADGKKVYFSQGNLTYNVTTKNWAFYEHQYDCATGYDANLISLFTWGYNATKSIVPDGDATDNVSIKEGNLSQDQDWGSQIGDGNTWRTLSKDEWVYLINKNGDNNIRKDKYKYGVTVCEKTNCLVLAPDDFEGTIVDSYNTAAWATAEAAGLVCLPAAGYREGSDVSIVNSPGRYWSSTAYTEYLAYGVHFNSFSVGTDHFGYRGDGYSVRLVTSGASTKPVVPVTGVTLNKTELILTAGETETLTATVLPADATNRNVIWTSDNTAVATVGSTDGKVTAVAGGTATITAIVDGLFTATCAVTVKSLPAGALAGEFTVNADGKQVHFSQGNLWYGKVGSATTATWNFETNQYDSTPSADGSWSTDHISHFYWSKDPNEAIKTDYNWEQAVSDKDVFFTNDTADATEPNAGFTVNVGDKEQSGWRTLSTEEWQYLFNTRSNASSLFKPGVTVCGKTNCVVLLPDNWAWNASTVGADWQKNTEEIIEYSESTAIKWSTMEKAGAVCLPAAGYRNGSDVSDVGVDSYYWSSAANGESSAYDVYFYSDVVFPNSEDGRNGGFSVRLMTDVK